MRFINVDTAPGTGLSTVDKSDVTEEMDAPVPPANATAHQAAEVETEADKRRKGLKKRKGRKVRKIRRIGRRRGKKVKVCTMTCKWVDASKLKKGKKLKRKGRKNRRNRRKGRKGAKKT